MGRISRIEFSWCCRRILEVHDDPLASSEHEVDVYELVRWLVDPRADLRPIHQRSVETDFDFHDRVTRLRGAQPAEASHAREAIKVPCKPRALRLVMEPFIT